MSDCFPKDPRDETDQIDPADRHGAAAGLAGGVSGPRCRTQDAQTALDDPKLPRLLFIGDSISGNYGKALRQTLKGKVNAHHPPTNCGPTGKGVGNIVNWLGAYEVKGRGWDVITFNFGHWDSGNTKHKYQANLEFVIDKLEKTGAKLIWVTTCPVPLGYGPGLTRRKAGRMKLQNDWAAEVMKRHARIMICDQWQFVKDNANGVYTKWWQGKNVHFGGPAADELGKLLARDVLAALAAE